MIEAGPFTHLRERGAKDERAAIVAWLREDASSPKRDLDDIGNSLQDVTVRVMQMLADAIERGEHLKDSTP